MIGFLLDTNIPSELTSPRPEAKVRAWFAAQELGTLYLSVVSSPGEAWLPQIILRANPGQ